VANTDKKAIAILVIKLKTSDAIHLDAKKPLAIRNLEKRAIIKSKTPDAIRCHSFLSGEGMASGVFELKTILAPHFRSGLLRFAWCGR
jgi:hypothetical protein